MRSNWKIVPAVFAMILVTSLSYAEDVEKRKIRGAYGEWPMTLTMTGEEIMSRARHEAKEDALRKAGVAENVWSIFGMMTTSTSNTFMEAYSEMSVMAIEGKVATSKEDGAWILNKSGNPVYTVKMDAEVTIDNTEEDKTYTIAVNGISTHYSNNDSCACTFSIGGYDSYVKVFFFNDEMSGMVFPEEERPEQKNMVFSVGQTYHFPEEGGGIQMCKNGEDPENIVILFVATKKNYPYLGGDDASSILQWIYNLPANERVIGMKQTTIY